MLRLSHSAQVMVVSSRHTLTAVHTSPDERGGDADQSDLRRGVARHATFCSRRSEEHTSELQSRQYLVCRLLLEKKNIDHNLIILIYNLLFRRNLFTISHYMYIYLSQFLNTHVHPCSRLHIISYAHVNLIYVIIQ